MRRPLCVAAVLAALAGCDGAVTTDSVVGRYTLVAYGGAPLVSGGVEAGALRLERDQTIPVYRMEWVDGGLRVARAGFYDVGAGGRIRFTETQGSPGVTDYSGAVDGDRITVDLNDGAYTTFTFERD